MNKQINSLSSKFAEVALEILKYKIGPTARKADGNYYPADWVRKADNNYYPASWVRKADNNYYPSNYNRKADGKYRP